MEENNYMEGHIRQSLKSFELQPNVQSFHNIMQQLDKEKKRRRFIFFLWSGAGSLLVLSALWLFVSLNGTKAENIVSEHKIMKQEKGQVVKANKKSPGTGAALKENKFRENNIHQTNEPLTESHQSKSMLNSATEIARPKKISTHSQDTGSEETESKIPLGDYKPEAGINSKAVPQQALENPFMALPQNTVWISMEHGPEEIKLTESPYMVNWDSLLEDKKRVNFYIGLGFDPQLGALIITRNKQPSSSPSTIPTLSAVNKDAYLADSKKNNKLRFNYAYGLRLGMNFRNRYELLLGLGFQKFTYQQSVLPFAPYTNSTADPLIASSNAYHRIIRYYNYTLEGSKIFTRNSRLRYKAGLAVHVDHLWYVERKINFKSGFFDFLSPYYKANPTPDNTQLLFTLTAKTGVMYNAGKRWQFQLCPSLYASLNSMMDRAFPIRQRPFGVGLEGMVLFRLY